MLALQHPARYTVAFPFLEGSPPPTPSTVNSVTAGAPPTCDSPTRASFQWLSSSAVFCDALRDFCITLGWWSEATSAAWQFFSTGRRHNFCSWLCLHGRLSACSPAVFTSRGETNPPPHGQLVNPGSSVCNQTSQRSLHRAGDIRQQLRGAACGDHAPLLLSFSTNRRQRNISVLSRSER